MNETKKILLADDYEPFRTSLSQELTFEWYDVVTAEDWKEALDLVYRYRDELLCIILDNNMPHLTWIEVAKEIRKNLAHILIIMISCDDKENLQWREAWINYFFEKIFNFDELLETIKKKSN